jgi:hypothetical protein
MRPVASCHDGRIVSWGVVRLFLAIWLAAFAAQATDLVASVIPDDCVEETRGSSTDPCPDNCARCVCCARLPVFVPQAFAPEPVDTGNVTGLLPPLEPSTSALPLRILHVPKAS